MNRREFSMLAGALGLAPVLGDIAFAQVGDAPRVRKDAATSDAGNDLAAYRKGVAALKKNVNATDYDSWMYWANSHGTPDAIPDAMRKVWYQCEHGTTHFLTWHRAYIFFFETLIREKSGEGSFALPYWNWFGSKQIPADFLSEQVDGHSNALFHPLRLYRDKTLVSAALGQSEFYRFGSMLEGNPHGTVHTMVGGDMGAVETSARDPLFWLHHCNIDRMWSVWLEQDSKHQNPSDSTWLNKQFVFDVAQIKKQRVSDLVAIGGVMNYAYDSLKPAGGSVTPVPLRPSNAVDVPLAQGASTLGQRPLARPLTITRKMPFALKGGSVALDFRVPGGASKRMETMSAPAAKGYSLNLVLKDVQATQAGIQRGVDYRIYLNLPRELKAQFRHDDFYLGSINSFALSHHQGAHPSTLTFDLGSLAPALSRVGQWSNTSVSVSLLSDDTEDTQPLIVIGDVQLLLSDAPLR